MNNDIQRLKAQIDLHDLANRLGLQRPDERGNYRSPHHHDKNPSLSVFDDGRRWKDFSADEGGDAIDLVEYVRGCDTREALDWIRSEYGIEKPKTNGHAPRKLTIPEAIAYRSSQTDPAPAVEYLAGRGIPEKTIEWALRRQAVGFNDWTSDRVEEGRVGHGGPAVAFPCRRLTDHQIAGVDLRYLNPDINGGLKTMSQGDKDTPYIPCLRAFAKARTVYVVESAINALSIEALGLKGATTLATRGTQTWQAIDWSICAGKRVILAMDADEPDDYGKRPGPEAAWAILQQLTALNIPCQILDQSRWYTEGWNDLNDILQAQGTETLRSVVGDLEPWLIPGLPGTDTPGRKRLFLPAHDWAIYWKYRVTEDFTRFIEKIDEDGDGVEQKRWKDVVGFRIAGISQVQIADHNSVRSGEKNAQPRVVYSVSVQRPGQQYELERRVLSSDRLHKLDQWDKFGSIFTPHHFKRLLSIMERTTGLTKIDAVNFVGLCWRDGRLVVNEGADCYFDDPEQQCPYHSLRFPTGTRNHARDVVLAYRSTYGGGAALRMLVWALGAHMKALLGFWPHMALQGPKGSGKSVLTERLERSIAIHVFGSEQIKTAFRLLCSVSSTSHPVGWEEISVNDQRVIDAAVAMLQQAYQSAHTTRGSEHTAFLISAPVLMAGEDVPVKSLTGKMIAVDLTTKEKGEKMPEDLVRFPVRQWLEFLAQIGRDQARTNHERWRVAMVRRSRAGEGDAGAQRMVSNYAAVMTAAGLLMDFAGCEELVDEFFDQLVTEMNRHMAATSHDREPWVWILEHILSDIDSGQFDYPHGVRLVDEKPCLIIKPSHIIQQLQTTSRYRQVWDSLPIKTTAVFKTQMQRAGVITKDTAELTFAQRRYQRMVALSISELHKWGLDVARPDDPFTPRETD